MPVQACRAPVQSSRYTTVQQELLKLFYLVTSFLCNKERKELKELKESNELNVWYSDNLPAAATTAAAKRAAAKAAPAAATEAAAKAASRTASTAEGTWEYDWATSVGAGIGSVTIAIVTAGHHHKDKAHNHQYHNN